MLSDPYYAILRSIPHKAGGIVAMGGSILVLLVIPFLNTSDVRNTTYRPIFKFCFWFFLADFVILTWVGQKPVRDSFILLGQIATLYYFIFFLVLIPVVGKIEFKLVHYQPSLSKKGFISHLKTVFSDFYLSFLVSIWIKKELPRRFMLISMGIGGFLGRYCADYFELLPLESVMLFAFLSIASLCLCFILTFGVYLLAVRYAKEWGNSLFTHMVRNASPAVLEEFRVNLTSPLYPAKNEVNSSDLTRRSYSTTRLKLGFFDWYSPFSGTPAQSASNALTDPDFVLKSAKATLRTRYDAMCDEDCERLNRIAHQLRRAEMSQSDIDSTLTRCVANEDTAMFVDEHAQKVAQQGISIVPTSFPTTVVPFDEIKIDLLSGNVEMKITNASLVAFSRTVTTVLPKAVPFAIGALVVGGTVYSGVKFISFVLKNPERSERIFSSEKFNNPLESMD